jgi:predicted RNA binding protein YcfA (HicA-like mRNA interferase family)
MADYYRDLIRLLQENGYEFKRQGRGDHEIWWNPRTRVNVTVDRKLKSKFTANGILKEAGLPKVF